MAGHTETLKSGYEAFARGDADGMTAVWNDDIRWEGTNSEELPGGGQHQGKQAVLQMLGSIQEAWDTFSVTPDEFIEQGDTVVVLGHAQGRAKATGNELKWPFVHVWRMRDGKVSKALILADTYEIAKTLGIVS